MDKVLKSIQGYTGKNYGYGMFRDRTSYGLLGNIRKY